MPQHRGGLCRVHFEAEERREARCREAFWAVVVHLTADRYFPSPGLLAAQRRVRRALRPR